MNRQTITVGFVLFMLLTPAVAPVLAAVQTVFVGSGTPISTQSGLEVKPGTDSQLNLQDPWQSSDSIEFKNVTFRGENAEITVDNFGDPAKTGGEWTNVSAVNAENGQVLIDRSDARQIGADGTVDAISVRSSDLSRGGQQVDITATSSGDWRLIVNDTGFAEGKGVVAKNVDTGEALDAANVNANGDVVFDQLEAVQNARINLESGAAEIKVYRESQPNKLVDGATLRIRVFGEDTVVERTVTNGRLDLTGVPVDERLTITAKDDEHFVYRRITVPSATQQEEIYLINGTANTNTAPVNFRIDDRTGGNFSPGETQFYVEKAITKDFDGDGTNETKYQVISGDTIGSSGEFPVVLETENRYRLRVTNDEGDTRLLGSYVVRGAANPEVTIGQVIIDSEGRQGYATQFRVIHQDSDGDGFDEEFVRFAYRDEDNATTELRYEIINESSGNTVESEALTNVNTHTNTIQVAQNKTDSTYRLNWTADRTGPDGTSETVSGERYAGSVPEIADRLPIDPRWLELIGYVSIVAVAGLVVITSSARASLVTTGWAGILTVLGIVTIPLPAIGLAGAVSVFAVIGGRR